MIQSEIIVGTEKEVEQARRTTSEFIQDEEQEIEWYNVSTDSGNFISVPDPIKRHASDIEKNISDEPLCGKSCIRFFDPVYIETTPKVYKLPFEYLFPLAMFMCTVLFVVDVFTIASMVSATNDLCDSFVPGVRTALMFHLVTNTMTLSIFLYDLRRTDLGIHNEFIRVFFFFYNLVTTMAYLLLLPLSMIPMVTSITRGGFEERFECPRAPLLLGALVACNGYAFVFCVFFWLGRFMVYRLK